MRITTLNLNGLRSATRKGFKKWLSQVETDVICLQEVRSEPGDIEAGLLDGWQMHWNPAEKKGYAGTAILTRKDGVFQKGCELERANKEGRVSGFSMPEMEVWSIYFPSGTSGEEKQAWKIEFLTWIRPWLDRKLQSGRPVVVCGDINIAHTAKDIKNAKANEKNSGFLPEERKWLTDLFASGWRDAFREKYPDLIAYSWWTIRGNAYANNVGWRIDYFFVSKEAQSLVANAGIHMDVMGSDHCPIELDLKL